MSRANRKRSRERPPDIEVTTAGWPLGRRLRLGTVRPGGAAGTARLLDGVRLRTGDRVVDLAPGSGETGLLATGRNLYSWIGICSDTTDAEQLAKAVPGAISHAQIGRPDVTGLPDASASVVVAEGLLLGMPDESKLAVLRESARILRPNGLLGLHELCISVDASATEPAAAVRDRLSPEVQGGIFPLTEAGWREIISSAGLEFVGVSHSVLEIPSLRDVMRQAGPRRGLEILGRATRPGATATHTRNAVSNLTRERDRLTAAVIIARRPYVGPLRGPTLRAARG
jgi:SAM-dependent methyltransferase